MPTRPFALALASIALISSLAIHLFLPAIPALKAEFGISDGLAQLTFSIGIFTLACSTVVYGSLSDRYGRRPVLLTGLCLFLAGNAICAVAWSLPVLFMGRLLQAAGAGCATTLVRSIARDAYGQDNLVKVIAYLMMFYTLGPMISPLVGGVLVDAFGWRATFVFALVLGGAITAGAYCVLHETLEVRGARLDAVGLLRSYVEPFRNPRFAAYLLQTGFSTGTFFVAGSAAAVIMKESLGRPASEFGLYFLFFPVGFLLGNLVSSRLGRRIGIEGMVLAGSAMLLAVIICQAMVLLSGNVTPLALFIPGFFITFAQGISLASTQAGAIAMMPKNAGTAAGLGVFTQNMLGAIVAQLYGMLADGTAVPMVVVMLASAVCSLIAGSIPYLMTKRGVS